MIGSHFGCPSCGSQLALQREVQITATMIQFHPDTGAVIERPGTPTNVAVPSEQCLPFTCLACNHEFAMPERFIFTSAERPS